MLKIHFTNIGHGDGILLEWLWNGKREIGIIDCNEVPLPSNPVIQLINEIKPDSVRFILMSHPHLDHYGGLWEVLNHCIQYRIPISRFFHTSQLTKKFLYYSVLGPSLRNKIMKLLSEVERLTVDPETEFAGGLVDSDSAKISLTSKINLEFLSPSYHDMIQYKNRAHQERDFHNLRLSVANNPEANVLSTTIRIFGENWQVLLTSDSEKVTLNRIWNERLRSNQVPLLCFQVPHHGSESNHCEELIRNISRADKSIAIISCGSNKYGHPSHKVTHSLCELGFDVRSTRDSRICSKNDSSNEKRDNTYALSLLGIPDFSEKEPVNINKIKKNICVTISDEGGFEVS